MGSDKKNRSGIVLIRDTRPINRNIVPKMHIDILNNSFILKLSDKFIFN